MVAADQEVQTSRTEDPIHVPTYLPLRRRRLVAQRVFDLTVVLLSSVVWLPVMAVVAVLVKVDSPGPVFYRQVRIGLQRKPFEIWKFRKMRNDLAVQGAMLTMRYDSRMTRMGRLLERTKLDELPQVVNVLLGTMSVVGPRPDVPKFVEHHARLWDHVLSVKPGIFGASQNHFRNESELYPADETDIEGYYVAHILPEMLALDGEYAAKASVRRDIGLLFGGVFRSVVGTISMRTLRNRWTHAASAAVVVLLGAASTSASLVMIDPDGPVYAVGLGAAGALIAALASGIPFSSVTSFTADDGRRILLAAAMRSGMLAVAMMAIDRRAIGTAVLIADGGLFLGGLFWQRLTLHLWSVHHVGPRSTSLRSALVWYSTLVAPVITAGVLLVRHGFDSWTGEDAKNLVAATTASMIVRPSFLLLWRPVGQRSAEQPAFTRELAGLLLAVVAGSGFVLAVAGLGERSGADPIDALLDGVLFGACMVAIAVWQSRRLARTAPAPVESPVRRAVIAGNGPLVASYLAQLDTVPRRRFDVVGVVTPEPARQGSLLAGHRLLAGLDGVAEVARTTPYDDVVVLGDTLDLAAVERLRSATAAVGAEFHVVRLGEISQADATKADA